MYDPIPYYKKCKVNRKEYGTLTCYRYTSLFQTPHYYLSMLVLHSLVLQIHSHQCILCHRPGLTEVLVYGGCALWLENHKKWCWPETNCRHYCDEIQWVWIPTLSPAHFPETDDMHRQFQPLRRSKQLHKRCSNPVEIMPGEGTNPSDADSPLKINTKTS